MLFRTIILHKDVEELRMGARKYTIISMRVIGLLARSSGSFYTAGEEIRLPEKEE